MGGMATVATIGLRSKMEGCRLFGIMDNSDIIVPGFAW